MNVVVGSVVFAEAMEYLDDFLESLWLQTVQDFSVMLVNDNIPIQELQQIIKRCPENFQEKIFVIDRSGNDLEPYILRIEMLKQAAAQDFELLVMLDCDDKASVNRVECICEQFDEKYAFFYNELLDFQGKRVMPALPRLTADYRVISECNYLGMSNGAIYLKRLSKEFLQSLYAGKTRIFDWYFYTRLLLDGAKGKKIEKCCTCYRLYEENLAGRMVSSREMLKKEMEVKKRHYGLLSDWKYYKDLLEIYEALELEGLKVEAGNGYWWSLINSKSQNLKKRGLL